MIGIYKITSPSGKHYIGQSVDIGRRWKHYENLCERHGQPVLFNSFKKYGVKSHTFEILEILDIKLNNDEIIEWLNSKELYYSLQFNSLSPNGLNLRIGNGRGHLSKEANEKNRMSHLGAKNHMYGKKTSEEIKRKIQSKLQGEGCYWYGKQLSEETKNKISKFRKNRKATKKTRLKISKANKGSGNGMFGRHHTEETKKALSEMFSGRKTPESVKQKISDKLKGRKITALERSHRIGGQRVSLRNPVDQFSLDGKFIKTHQGIEIAAKEVGCGRVNISHTCTGRQKTAFGFIWKYHNKQTI